MGSRTSEESALSLNMHICIITRKLPPENCGIGDHTLQLKKSLLAAGHKVTIIVGKGSPDHDRFIVADDWSAAGLAKLFGVLESLSVDHVILQFTPLIYSPQNGHTNFALVKFWQSCSHYWSISIILHETYFRAWWHPPSWWRGTMQKKLLLSLATASNYIFTASQLLVQELNNSGIKEKVSRLPLGSHFPLVESDRHKLRCQYGIADDEIVLTLFGGGTALQWLRTYVDELDTYLQQHKTKVRWLLLGGAPQTWFKFINPVISPGYLSTEEVSAWLQAADIFLVPHECGLNAKRSTVAAAMQHGLPIVGTRGYMTDPFWAEVSGVSLTPIFNSKLFCQKVHQLCISKNLRQVQGEANRQYYLSNFTWDKIAHTFLNTIQPL